MKRTINNSTIDINIPDSKTYILDNRSSQKSNTPPPKYTRSKKNSTDNMVRSQSSNSLTVDNPNPKNIHNPYLNRSKKYILKKTCRKKNKQITINVLSRTKFSTYTPTVNYELSHTLENLLGQLALLNFTRSNSKFPL